jgi:hypothetical protein
MSNFYNKYLKYKKKYYELVKKIVNLLKDNKLELFIVKLSNIKDINILTDIKKYTDLLNYNNFFYKYDISNIIFKYIDVVKKDKILLHLNSIKINKKKLHILSDIDDTIYSTYLGGSDNSYINNKIYPGLLDIFDGLIKDTKYVTFISARPELFSGKNVINLKYNQLSGNLLTVIDGIKSIISKFIFNDYNLEVYSNIYKNKILSYKKYKLIYPEYKFILFGDLGQADIILTNEVLRDKNQIAILKDIYLSNNKWISDYLKEYIDKLKLKYKYRLFVVKTYPEFIIKLLNRYNNKSLNEEILNNLLTKIDCKRIISKIKSNIYKIENSVYKDEIIKLLNINI